MQDIINYQLLQLGDWVLTSGQLILILVILVCTTLIYRYLTTSGYVKRMMDNGVIPKAKLKSLKRLILLFLILLLVLLFVWKDSRLRCPFLSRWKDQEADFESFVARLLRNPSR